MPSSDFSKLVPGFDFLQNLMKGAGAGAPAVGQWIAPTLDPDEIDKRIQELRTVQFWLEQNAKMLAATIQALEVQRMTLATLRTMNLPMQDLRESMKLDPADFVPKAPAAAAAAAPAPAPAPPGSVDPMQWWGALTRQFTELAAQAIKDAPVQAATGMAGAAPQRAVQPGRSEAAPPAARGKRTSASPARKAPARPPKAAPRTGR